MKFHIDKHVLLKPLSQATKTLPKNSIIEIISGILLQVDQSGLTITAGDTVTSIRINVSPEDFQFERAGSIVLPGKKFFEIVQKAPDDILIEVLENYRTRIKSGSSKFELSGLDAEQYPVFKSGNGAEVNITGETLKSMVTKTVFAIADEKSGAPILTGVQFQFEDGRMTLTATDRHRLARSTHIVDVPELEPIVVKGESLSELIKLIDMKDEVTLSFYDNKLMARTKDFTFISSILEGTFPAVNSNIPVDFNTIVTVKTKQLSDAIDRILIVADEEKTKQVNITIGEDMLIESKVSGGFNASESLGISSVDGEGFKVTVNAKFVQEALKSIDTEEVKINYVKSLSPIIFKESGDCQDIQLLLPYRTA